MRIKCVAAGLACLQILLLPQPSWADWKNSLVRAVATPLINRGINYMFSRKWRNPQTKTVSAKPKLPPPPTVPKSTKLEVPPPPNTLVPPPPPGVPTGAILGMYPPELNDYKPEGVPAKPPEAPAPKTAPDFHKGKPQR